MDPWGNKRMREFVAPQQQTTLSGRTLTEHEPSIVEKIVGVVLLVII